MQLMHIVAIIGSASISGCIGSMGALTAAVGEGSLHKQATTLWSQGAVQSPVPV